MKVSIIVPVYNAAKFLDATITALRRQTLEDVEIILIDDGSADLSSAICKRHSAEDRRLRFYKQMNAGVSVARNKGIAMANGDYLMFCDADDQPDCTMAEKLYQKATEERADCVLCSYVKSTGQRSVIDELPFVDTFAKREQIMDQMVMPMLVWSYAPEGRKYQSIYGSVWRGLYSTGTIRKNRILFDAGVRLGEDLLFNEAFWPSCKRIAFIQEPLYKYNENLSSATHTNAAVMWNQYQTVWQRAHALLIELGVNNGRLRWHNYQLTLYAVNSIIASVCTQSFSPPVKIRKIRDILRNDLLQKARRDLPPDLGIKERAISALLFPSAAPALWAYYQQTVLKEQFH